MSVSCMNPHTLPSALSRISRFVKYVYIIPYRLFRRSVLGVGVNKARTALVLFFGSAATVFAAIGNPPAGGGQTVTFTDPLGGKTFGDVAKIVVDVLVGFAIPILGIMIIWGAFQLITSGGDPSKISAGKKTLLWAVVGFAIVLLAKYIPAEIQTLLGS